MQIGKIVDIVVSQLRLLRTRCLRKVLFSLHIHLSTLTHFKPALNYVYMQFQT